MINGSVNQEDITVLNIYASNNSASKSMKQNLLDLRAEVDTFLV